MKTEEVEALAKVAETAFVMGGSGGWDWDDAIHADCEEAGVVQKLRDVAIAVARDVRAHDAARGGTLSEAQEADAIRLTLMGDRDAAEVLREHMTAQGRANAALTQERDEWQEVCSLVLGPEDSSPVEAERNLRKLLDVRTTLEKERDEARAELAKAQERVADVEEDLLRAKEDVETNQRVIAEQVELRMAAESALATLRQAVEPFVKIIRWQAQSNTNPHVVRYSHSDGKTLLVAYDATPTEHPDTATLRGIRERFDGNDLRDVIATALGYDVSKLDDYPADLRRAEDVTRAVERHLLGDSGPSGGGETCPMGHPCAGDSPAEVEKSRCPHSDFGDGVCTLPAGHAEPHRLSHDAPEIEDNSDSAFHTRLTASEEATLRMHINRAKAPPNDWSKHAKGCTVEWTPTPSGPTPRVWTCAPDCPSKATTPPDVAVLSGGHPHVCGTEGDECPKCHRPGEDSLTTPDVAASEPTPEEDWRAVEDALDILPTGVLTTAERDVLSALARLKAEPRRAAEAMRDRCANLMDVRARGDLAQLIRALPLG